MTLLCSVAGHTAETTHHHNQGLDFTRCHRCGCDLIRPEADGEWTEVPKGFRVVWREFGRTGDAASVAARMGRMAPPPRREPRNARPQPKRDRRGKPLTGAMSMFGALSNLGKLVSGNHPVEDTEGRTMETSGQYVICLPAAAG
ncbi:hypothetical protein ACFQ1E_12565 [Sphingomonas canadensis]|uniref:Uncharacterized protein n=1 Tax=Sphingomonas canadensis TaxID=1219257 RepID=A0ABW3H9Q7_9SPHN|nr:hypothetical protein [Sphingomonas canadensis]MCW3836691.1 hypothetical protein [Sphingomonas canadensis]